MLVGRLSHTAQDKEHTARANNTFQAIVDTQCWSAASQTVQDKERNVRTAHGAVVPRPGLKFVAVELCRERLGELECCWANGRTCSLVWRRQCACMCLGSLQACPAVRASLQQCAGPSQCDKRQALEATRQRFPGVDFRCAAGMLLFDYGLKTAPIGWQAGRGAVALPGRGLKVGPHFCYCLAELQMEFPTGRPAAARAHREAGHVKVQSQLMDFRHHLLVVCSLIGSDEDTSWEAGHVESESSVVVRGFEFLNWLMQVSQTS